MSKKELLAPKHFMLFQRKNIERLSPNFLKVIHGRDMLVLAYADRKDIIDVNIVAVSGNRIGVYDKALPVKILPE